jgi:hypothetical protein
VGSIVKQPRFKLEVHDGTIVPQDGLGTAQDLHIIAVRVHFD